MQQMGGAGMGGAGMGGAGMGGAKLGNNVANLDVSLLLASNVVEGDPWYFTNYYNRCTNSLSVGFGWGGGAVKGKVI